jgi:hypothetical protein
MSMPSKPAAASLLMYSESCKAPAMQPTHSSMFCRTSAATSPRVTTSDTANRPPGFKTRNASRNTWSLLAVTFRINWHNFFGIIWHISPPAKGGLPKETEAINAHVCQISPKEFGQIIPKVSHDQSKPLEQINAELRQQGFYKAFPPPGIEVVTWYVMMGIGQVVTLRVPAERLREVNRAIEETAWGGFRTDSIRLTTSKLSLRNFTPKGSELIYGRYRPI